MKARALLLFISFACASTVYSFGQVNCGTSTKLICEFPISAEVLGTNTFGQPYIQHAEVAANPINASVAAQLTQLPIPSASVGVVTVQDKSSPLGRPFDNLGPILTDRPDTVGRHHLFAGFSYQHFNFNSLDGAALNSLPVAFSYSQVSPFNANDTQTFYGSETNDISFKLDQYVAVVTYGATRTMDISVVVPFNSVTLAVTSTNFLAYYYDSASNQYINESPSAGTRVSTQGSASGIGDVTVNVKQMLIGGEGSRGAVAAGAAFRFPTGDALNYLGSGGLGANIYALGEYRARVAPHVKLSYQYNDVSQVMNLEQPPTIRLPGGLQYDFGADVKATTYLTFAGDLLGSQFINTPSFTLSTSNLPVAPGAGSGIPTTYTTVGTFSDTYTTSDLSGGVKFAWKHFLFYGNVLKQLNNVGLRSNLVPLFGIAFKR